MVKKNSSISILRSIRALTHPLLNPHLAFSQNSRPRFPISMIPKNCQTCGKGFGFFNKKAICQYVYLFIFLCARTQPGTDWSGVYYQFVGHLLRENRPPLPRQVYFFYMTYSVKVGTQQLHVYPPPLPHLLLVLNFNSTRNISDPVVGVIFLSRTSKPLNNDLIFFSIKKKIDQISSLFILALPLSPP